MAQQATGTRMSLPVARQGKVGAGLRPRRGRSGGREALLAYAYLTPALVVLLLFSLGPFAYVFYASLLHAPLAPNESFVGLDNYRYLLDPAQQSGFLQALTNTAVYVLGVVPGGIALSLLCAFLLHRAVRGWAVFRLLFFIPYVTPVLSTAIIWLWIFNPNSYGLLNFLLGLIHVGPLGWANDPNWAMPSVIIYSLWQSAGFNTVVFLAGLAAIPKDLQEAARTDGATEWAVTRRVTLPLLTPTIFFVLIVSTIESLKVFTQVFALTGSNGAGGATMTLGLFLYQQLNFQHLDVASAVAVILFVLTVIFTLIQSGLSRRWVHYG